MTTERFISIAKRIHGSKYSYEHSKVDKKLKRIIITCPKHGDVEISWLQHLNGKGCPICEKEEKERLKREELEEKNRIKKEKQREREREKAYKKEQKRLQIITRKETVRDVFPSLQEAS